MTLDCNVINANPPVPEDGYVWSYLPVTQIEPVTLPARGRSLTLDHVTAERRGWYFCQASNQAGAISASLLVRVLRECYTGVGLGVGWWWGWGMEDGGGSGIDADGIALSF